MSFLGELSSSKRKTLRKERAAVRAEGVEFDWLKPAANIRKRTGRVLRILHGHRRAQMGPALSDARVLQPYRPDHVRTGFAGDGGGAAARPSRARSISSAAACFTGATGAAPNMLPFLHFRGLLLPGDRLRDTKGLAKVEAGAQGEHKLLRGYQPVPTYSAHFIAHDGLRRAVAAYLDAERAAMPRTSQTLPRRPRLRKGRKAHSPARGRLVKEESQSVRECPCPTIIPNIFAKIIRGEIPCVKVYEDDKTLAFMDVMPQRRPHPWWYPGRRRKHFDLSPDGAAALIKTAQKVAHA